MAKKFPDLRLFFIEIDELLTLLKGLHELLGISIDHLLIEAERPLARKIIEVYIPSPVIAYIRNNPDWLVLSSVAERVFDWICDYMRAMGYGTAKLLSYRGRKGCQLRVRNPHALPLVIGTGLGIYQRLLGVNMEVAWEKENGTTLLELKPTGEKPYNVPLPHSETRPGDVTFKRCDRCGVPLMVGELFEWDLPNGIITNRVSDYREAFLSVEGINAIFREMEKELGEDVLYRVAQLQLELLRNRLDGRILREEGGIWALFEEMKIRGMGNPVEVDEVGRHLRVKVDNPFNDALIAGRIAGYYEALEQVESRVTWVTSEEGYVIVGVDPKG